MFLIENDFYSAWERYSIMKDNDDISDDFIFSYLSKFFIPEIVQQVVEKVGYTPPTSPQDSAEERKALESERIKLGINLHSLKTDLMKMKILKSANEDVPIEYLKQAIEDKKNEK